MGQLRTDEFRKDAVRIALTSGLTRRQVADDLGVGLSTLNKWVTLHRDTDVVSQEDRDLAAENERLRRENRLLKEEREILKRQRNSLRVKSHEVQVHRRELQHLFHDAFVRGDGRQRPWISGFPQSPRQP